MKWGFDRFFFRMSRTGAKGIPLPGGPAGAFAIAFGAVGAVYLMMKYVRRLVKNSTKTNNL